jgi:uncharacterized protein (DUF58 family)
MPRELTRPVEGTHLAPSSAEAFCAQVAQHRYIRWLLPSGGFGPRTFTLLVLGLVWIGPAWFEPRFLWAMAAWDGLVLLLWAWDYSRLPKPSQIRVRRIWKEPVAFGTPSNVEIELRNPSRIGIFASVVDDVPPQLSSEPPECLLRIPPGQTVRGSYRIVPRERGDLRLGHVHVRYQSALRIAERWASADLSQTVRVYPNLEEARRQMLYLIRSRQVALERRLRRHRGQGRDFESLREYRFGDSWRDICWTASARRHHLVTKEYQVERSQTVWIVLDAGRLLRSRVYGPSKLDHAVNAALSLAQVSLYSGDRVGLLAYGRRIQQQVPPGKGPGHLRAILERLALVHTEASEANHVRAAETLLARQTRRSLVVWLTDLSETATTPEVIENAMQMATRHLVLFGVIQQPELVEVAARPPDSVNEMYRHIAAQEMLDRREVLLEQLRQRGVLALQFEAARLSALLVNQYLEIKERSLL